MKITRALQVGVPSIMITRLVRWQCLLGLWLVGESGFSSFLAPRLPKAWKEESLPKSSLLEDDRFAKTQDIELTLEKNSSQQVAHNGTQTQQPLIGERLLQKNTMQEPQIARNRNQTQQPSTSEKLLQANSTEEQPRIAVVDVHTPQVTQEADWQYKKRTVRHKSMSKEGKLINFMRKYAADESDVDCMIWCRYGERKRHSWRHCLSQCVKDTLKRQSFMTMLPEENSAAKDLDYDVPPEFEKDLKRIKSDKKQRERHGEL